MIFLYKHQKNQTKLKYLRINRMNQKFDTVPKVIGRLSIQVTEKIRSGPQRSKLPPNCPNLALCPNDFSLVLVLELRSYPGYLQPLGQY